MTDTVAIVYHSADFDGLGCYAIAREAYLKNGWSVKPYPYNNGEAAPALDELLAFARVVVGDIALPPAMMLALYEHGTLVWVDHHATSIALSEKMGYSKAMGIRRVGVGACELMWEQMNPGTVCPPEIQLFSAYDVYDKERFDWESVTLPFQYGMRNRYNLDAERFAKDFAKDELAGATAIREGLTILDYIRSSGRIAASAYGFDVTIDGKVRALGLLTTSFGSLPSEEYATENGYDVVVNVNRSANGKYKVSCYSARGDAPIDLGEYLQDKYGGGGHHNAAGATLTREKFLRLIDDGIL